MVKLSKQDRWTMIEKVHLLQLEVLLENRMLSKDGAEVLTKLYRNAIPFLILTEQTGRTRDSLVEFFHASGMTMLRPDNFYTSAMAAVDWLSYFHPDKKRAAYIGGNGIKLSLQMGGFQIDYKNPDVLIVGMDRNLSYKDYSDYLQMILSGTTLMSTDNRLIQRFEGAEMIGNRAIVKMLEEASGVEAISFGRGSRLLPEMAMRYLNVSPDNILLVGNDFQKDIVPAIDLTMFTAYITGGNSIMSLGMSDVLHPDYLLESLGGLTK